jgi:inner membrane protein
MPNARTHMIIGAVTTAVAALVDDKPSKVTHNIVAAPLIGAAVARLPDILEPALHPNHRQLFHSITTLLAVGTGVIKAYKWEPETPFEGVLRGLIVLGGVAYISHLLADGSTPKGLPLFGKLSGG